MSILVNFVSQLFNQSFNIKIAIGQNGEKSGGRTNIQINKMNKNKMENSENQEER